MLIRFNGKSYETENNNTLNDFIKNNNLDPDRIVIELNMDIVKKENWKNIILKENDELEVLRFVGGG